MRVLQTLSALACASLLFASLSACGKKGPLYLPEPEPKTTQATE